MDHHFPWPNDRINICAQRAASCGRLLPGDVGGSSLRLKGTHFSEGEHAAAVLASQIPSGVKKHISH